MSFRRLSVSALSALMLGATSLLGAAPAQAAGECSVSLPTKISITSPYKEVKVSFSGECVWDDGYGAWSVTHPTEGIVDYLIFDASDYAYPQTQYMGIYDWEPRGTWNTRGEGAWDSSYNSLMQNERTTSVRLGSRNSLSGARSGNYVTLTAKATRYLPSQGAYRNWSGATTKFYSQKSDGTWRYLKTVTTDSYGKATAKVYASTTRKFKAVTSSTSSTWGRTSSAITR